MLTTTHPSPFLAPRARVPLNAIGRRQRRAQDAQRQVSRVATGTFQMLLPLFISKYFYVDLKIELLG